MLHRILDMRSEDVRVDADMKTSLVLGTEFLGEITGHFDNWRLLN
jgi:hypothetical protein